MLSTHSPTLNRRVILILAIYTLAFAIFAPDRADFFTNYSRLIQHQTFLFHDFISVGGLSATFFNVSCHFLIAYFLLCAQPKLKLNGLFISAIGMFVAHSFFGTHLLNIWPAMFGVWCYSKWVKQPFRSFSAVSLYATASSPFVSYWLFNENANTWTALLALLLGIGIGFVSAPLAERFLNFHQGFSLYNFGFTMGIIAMFARYTLTISQQTPVPSVQLYSTDGHWFLVTYIIGLLILLWLYALQEPAEIRQHLHKLWLSTGRAPDDFITKFGAHTTVANMAINGTLLFLFLWFFSGPFSGPTVGGLCAVIAFSAFGKHIRNCFPIICGFLFAATMMGVSWQSPNFMLSISLATTLAPIAGYYGFGYGLLAGFLQLNTLAVVFPLHQGLSLYNSGFSAGFVAGFLVPIFDTLKREND